MDLDLTIRNFIKIIFFKIIEIILSVNTKYYITINNSDFKFVIII